MIEQADRAGDAASAAENGPATDDGPVLVPASEVYLAFVATSGSGRKRQDALSGAAGPEACAPDRASLVG